MPFSASKIAGFGCLIGLMALLTVLAPTRAEAQFTIEIGISRDKAVKRMVDLGYSQISILKKGFKTIRAEACQDGIRYEVRVADGYQVSNVRQTGVCRRTVNADAIEQNLANSGYTRIVIDTQNGNFVALACRNENRLRITFSRQGEVLQRRKIGRCEEIFQPNDVRQVLRQAGYNRIQFLDRQLPWYRAEACLGQDRLELLLTRFGEVRRSVRTGSCDPELQPSQLVRFMENKGYSQIEVIDRRLPSYVVSACLNNSRLELELDRFGQITNRKQIGQCRAAMDEEEIAALLEKEGFTRVNIRKRRNGNFDISACFEGREKFATLSSFGELLSERDGQRCAARSITEIQSALEGRGFNDIRFSAEGCRFGRKVKVYFDQNGDRIGREKLGNC